MDESVEAILHAAALVGDTPVTEVELPFPRFDSFELLPTL